MFTYVSEKIKDFFDIEALKPSTESEKSALGEIKN